MNCRNFLPIALLTISNCWADPVWHCSRHDDVTKPKALAQADQFFMASLGNSDEVIGVSIRDLMDVYSGIPVKVGGHPLSACFISENDAALAPVLKALGLQVSAAKALAQKNTIVQSRLYRVTDEASMQACIGKHFPAVGYLLEPTETANLMPCF